MTRGQKFVAIRRSSRRTQAAKEAFIAGTQAAISRRRTAKALRRRPAPEGMATISVTPTEMTAALRHFRDHLDHMSEEQQAQFRDRLRAYLEGRLHNVVWQEIVRALGKARRGRDLAYDFSGWRYRPSPD